MGETPGGRRSTFGKVTGGRQLNAWSVRQHEEVRPVPSVRRLTRHEWREYRELRLRALADSPAAFATTLADAQARGDEDWSRQVASGAESPSEIALVAETDAQLVGLAWSRIDDSDPHRAHLYQMWVDPGFRGLG